MKNKKFDKTTLFSIMGIICIVLFIAFIDKIFPSPDIDGSSFTNVPSAVDNSFYTIYPQYKDQVVFIEFSDFECPFCQRNYETINKLRAKYAGRVVFEYKHFPLASIHPNALNAALASECARRQGKFWEYHDSLFENQNRLSAADLGKYAQNRGLDMDKFQTCIANKESLGIIQKDYDDALKLGIEGTPTYYVNGKKIVGGLSYSEFDSMLSSALKEADAVKNIDTIKDIGTDKDISANKGGDSPND